MLDVIDRADQQADDVIEGDDAIHCRACQALVTGTRWRLVMREAHDHTVFNPAGIVFRVLCFSEAPGATGIGPWSDHFTWFPGYRWQVAICRGCTAHLGWAYRGLGSPPNFVGLIKKAIVTP